VSNCTRCDGEGWVCEVCAEPEANCDCIDEIDDDEEEPELRRCRSCNPWPPIANLASPAS
jgi:hypothetical protein